MLTFEEYLEVGMTAEGAGFDNFKRKVGTGLVKVAKHLSSNKGVPGFKRNVIKTLTGDHPVVMGVYDHFTAP